MAKHFITQCSSFFLLTKKTTINQKFNVLFTFFLLINVTTINAHEVVIYTSLDQVFSEPILLEYEKITGVKVRPVYDVEATKTTGMVNRLIAEKSRPKCDVFWNSEIGKTIILKRKGVLESYVSTSAKNIPQLFKDKDAYWTGFAARARVLIYNTKLLSASHLPNSIFDLIKPEWKEKIGLAYPLFGTTATHIAALYDCIGKEKTETFLKKLKANGVKIVDGNSVVRDIVVYGQIPIGFTDTDDAYVAVQAGKEVDIHYIDQKGIGTLLIPNTIALIKNSPNPEQGKKLIDYLLSSTTESKLSYSKSAQIPLRDNVKKPNTIPNYSSIKWMKVDYEKIAEYMEESARFCQRLFVR